MFRSFHKLSRSTPSLHSIPVHRTFIKTTNTIPHRPFTTQKLPSFQPINNTTPNHHHSTTTTATTPTTRLFIPQTSARTTFASRLFTTLSISFGQCVKKAPIPKRASIPRLATIPLAPRPLTIPHPLLTTTISRRTLFGFGTPDRITIPGTKIPVSPWKKLRKWIFRLTLLGTLIGGGLVYWLIYLTDHLDQVMRFNIRFRGQGDIHYYATASRVNHKYTPQFTGDKVSDIKLLQAKLIRDIYKIYLATDPMERNQDLINRYLGEQKVKALREMAAQDPELAQEITKEVYLEAQYGLTVTTDVINAMLQNILSIYIQTTYTNPTHRNSVDHLHKQFEQLKVLEQDLEPMVEFATACLDALVEGSVATPYQDPKKVPVYESNLTDQFRFGRPV